MKDIGETQAERLLRCPFCGGEAKIGYAPDGFTGGGIYTVRCMTKKCTGRRTKLFSEKDVAIAAWNRRTPEPMTSVIEWVTFSRDDVSTYPSMGTHVLFEGDGEVIQVFYSSKPTGREWITDEGERIPLEDGDVWARFPMPQEVKA